MPPTVTPAHVGDDAEAEAHEQQHVHAVYDEIASHFSSTRYKPWPVVANFLASQPAGSVGLDSGTGNGKYLSLPHDRPSRIWTIGLDRSRRLLELAQRGGHGARREVVLGDALGGGWRPGAFDYALSIATIHHLATPARRRLAISTLLRCLSPSHGRLLIYVWAVEQDQLSKRVLPPAAGTGQSQSCTSGQDVFVPWVLADQDTEGGHPPRVINRYYHMFGSGELEMLVREAAAALDLQVTSTPQSAEARGRGLEIVQCGWERSNWYIEIKRWEKP